MSISPIREAVRQLEALGLAKHVPHQGARVLDFDPDELRDLFEVRLALESLAVRRAAERTHRGRDRGAREHLASLDERGSRRRASAMRAHTEFHFSLYDACGGPWLLQTDQPGRGTARSASGPRSSPRPASFRTSTARWTGDSSRHASATTRARVARAVRASRPRRPVLRARARRARPVRPLAVAEPPQIRNARARVPPPSHCVVNILKRGNIMSRKVSSSIAALGAAALVAVVAGSAFARSQADIYSVHSLVSDNAPMQARRDRHVAREWLGPLRRPDHTVVDGQQRHELLDALQRRRSRSRR